MKSLSRHRPNLLEIAKVAGVSNATVSLALNHKPGVSEKLSRRIHTIAEQMGYQRDAKLAELMSHVAARRRREEHSVLALITHHERPRAWESVPSLLSLWEGGSQRARELGYKLEEFRYNEPGMSPARLRGILLARNIKGLLFSISPPKAPHDISDFDLTGFSAATWDLCLPAEVIGYVASDHFHDVITCLRRAYDLGYRRPLLAMPGAIAARILQLMQGAYLAFSCQYPDVARLPFHVGGGSGFAPLRAHVEKHRPDVVLCTERIRGAGMPQDCGWITLDRMPGELRLAGLDRHSHQQAGSLVDLVVSGLHRNEGADCQPPKGVLSPGVFIDGPSLPPKVRPRLPAPCAQSMIPRYAPALELAGHGWT